jgi:hypothetical protein
MQRCGEFGGDPLHSAHWEDFRPLRLRREEDWSDWLYYLLQFSKRGDFARGLFSDLPSGHLSPKVTREEFLKTRRADLIIDWQSGRGRFDHIEVKLWDSNFGKCASTAEKALAKYKKKPGVSVREWKDHVLIRRDALTEWGRFDDSSSPKFNVLFWSDVAHAIRKALCKKRESFEWLAFAFAFVGNIERRILLISDLGDSVYALSVIADQLDIWKGNNNAR